MRRTKETKGGKFNEITTVKFLIIGMGIAWHYIFQLSI
jgi:hypothetical protein